MAIQKTIRERDYIFMQDLYGGEGDSWAKGGRKEELGEEERVSLNTLSLKKTRIWQDYSTSLELKRGEEGEIFVCHGIREMGSLYSSGGGNMNGRPFNEG